MRKLYKFLIAIGIIALFLFLLSFRATPAKFTYGISFSKFHSDELGLDWKKVYLALLDELKVRNFRFSAHWPATEPKDGKYDFSVLDFQMQEAQSHNASVILAVGRRLPGWPECHTPDWAQKLTVEERNKKLLEYITITVNRYKSFKNIKYWQVENEPFLTFFSRSTCGALDEEFLKKEVALVHELDSKRQVLVTDSGEFGSWYGAYNAGDVFGTSMYLYIWNKTFNIPFRYPLTPAFFRIKQNIIEAVHQIIGHPKKHIILIELSGEPWLIHPIVETPISVLLDRMGVDKITEMISFAKKSDFDTAYLWGGEWWYWMRNHNHPEFWEMGTKIFAR
jgi:hypothetical protein